MTDGDEYDSVMPEVRRHVEKFRGVLSRVRTTHSGRPVDEVQAVLATECAAEGIEVWREVVEEAARLISSSPGTEEGFDRDARPE